MSPISPLTAVFCAAAGSSILDDDVDTDSRVIVSDFLTTVPITTVAVRGLGPPVSEDIPSETLAPPSLRDAPREFETMTAPNR
ncbi:hypothetical protein [Nannocystis pusilla]|uniref:hypothetical protein n=1 Tax=Nannocystis pusilla TaxID=889268 RepID=UPI003DA60342